MTFTVISYISQVGWPSYLLVLVDLRHVVDIGCTAVEKEYWKHVGIYTACKAVYGKDVLTIISCKL